VARVGNDVELEVGVVEFFHDLVSKIRSNVAFVGAVDDKGGVLGGFEK